MSQNSASGNVEPLVGDEQYDDGFLSEGRLGFYLKGKIKGKYLVTAQADTQDRELQHLFDGFLEATQQDVFRRLDPDQYYPVYGDLVISTRLAGGTIVPYGSTHQIQFWDRFYAGGTGINPVRGYGRRRVGPLSDSDDPIGGRSVVVGSLEFRHPIFGPVQGIAFVDAGDGKPIAENGCGHRCIRPGLGDQPQRLRHDRLVHRERPGFRTDEVPDLTVRQRHNGRASIEWSFGACGHCSPVIPRYRRRRSHPRPNRRRASGRPCSRPWR